MKKACLALMIFFAVYFFIGSSAEDNYEMYDYLYELFTNKDSRFYSVLGGMPENFALTEEEQSPLGHTALSYMEEDGFLFLHGMSKYGIEMGSEWWDLPIDKAQRIIYYVCLNWGGLPDERFAIYYLYDDDYIVIENINDANAYCEAYENIGIVKEEKVIIENGSLIIMPDYECVCPLTIFADDDVDYYVYLKYKRPPLNTEVKRSPVAGCITPVNSDIAFYVEAGESANVDVPIGIYELYYATGNEFYNTEELFGEETRSYKADSMLIFYADNEYFNGHTLTLYPVTGGNFDTNEIAVDKFPTP